jgi:hypothetical protein
MDGDSGYIFALNKEVFLYTTWNRMHCFFFESFTRGTVKKAIEKVIGFIVADYSNIVLVKKSKPCGH